MEQTFLVWFYYRINSSVLKDRRCRRILFSLDSIAVMNYDPCDMRDTYAGKYAFLLFQLKLKGQIEHEEKGRFAVVLEIL